MKISDLSSLLTKVQSIAGDVEVVLKSAETELETVITDLAVHISPETGSTGGTLEVEHAPAVPAPLADPSPPSASDETPQP